jgi:Bacterial Ig-like domain (group 3)/Pectate lyase superfamily protein/Dockerin type I domain
MRSTTRRSSKERSTVRRWFKPRFEALESRHLLSGSPLPFDDSGLAPAGLQAVCALPNLPVFNVHNYGAIGDGTSDDTVAIRTALSAAEAAGGGIIYLPAGTYAVDPQASDPVAWGPIFTITASNIVFIGDGAGSTHLAGYVEGLKDPVTNWFVTGDSYAKIGRFSMFSINSSASQAPIANVQFRSLDINGDAPYTGNAQVGGDPTTGDGWDLSHKAIRMDGAHQISGVLVFNCNVENWRGEEIYAGGNLIGTLDVINCHVWGSNASAVSCSANLLLNHVTIGGSSPGNDVYNGIENFDFPTQGTTIQDSTIMCSADPALRHGIGLSFEGEIGSSFSVTNSTFANNHFGILFQDTAHGALVDGSTFTNNGNAMMTSILGLYSGVPLGFSDFTISNNTFNGTGAAFLPQNYGTSSTKNFPNLVLNHNTVTNGVLLDGGFGGGLGQWPGFLVENNTLGTGASDINEYDQGYNVGLWTGTIRPAFGTNAFYRSGNVFNDYSGQAAITIHFQSDLTVLNDNTTVGSLGVTIDPSTLAGYPIGFTTTIYRWSKTNWVLKADPTWNTFSTDLPVGPTGVTIRVNGQGRFEANGITSTSMTSSVNPSVVGQSLTFTAVVSDNTSNVATPTGTVVFAEDTTILGSATLDPTGRATFATSVLEVGTHAITATYGGDTNYLASAGQLTQSVNPAIVNNSIAPRIQAVYLSSAAWNSTLLTYLQANGIGSAQLGYQLLGGANQLAPLPWSNVSTLSVVFSEDVRINRASIGLSMIDPHNAMESLVLSLAFAIAPFSYNSASHTAQWTLSSPLIAHEYLLTVPSTAATNSLGLTLDGEWINATGSSPGSQFPSGDGVAGGDFNFRFNVLPGDVDQNGTVTVADLNLVRGRMFNSASAGSYSPFADLDGNGTVSGLDGAIVRHNLSTSLAMSNPSPSPMMSGSGVSSGSALAGDASLAGDQSIVGTLSAPQTPTADSAISQVTSRVDQSPPVSEAGARAEQVSSPTINPGSVNNSAPRLPSAAMVVIHVPVATWPTSSLDGPSAGTSQLSTPATGQFSTAERDDSVEFGLAEPSNIPQNAGAPSDQRRSLALGADCIGLAPGGDAMAMPSVSLPTTPLASGLDTQLLDSVFADLERDPLFG